MRAVRCDWPRVPIEEVYLGLYDGPHATPKPADEGPIFLGIKNITEDGRLDLSQIRHISECEYPRWTKRVTPQPGDIVFTYEATLNRYAIVPEGFRGCLGRRTALIRPDPKKVDTRYLFYYFFGAEWRSTIARNMLIGSTVDRIPLGEFPTFEIALPPLSEQERIANILSSYDDLIENNTRRTAVLKEMAQAIYREWFVNFRFPGHEQVEMVESKVGPVPAGWEVKRVEDAITLSYGKALKANDRNDGSVPVYGSSGVVGYHDRGLVHGPGIVVGRKGNVGSVHWCDTDFYPIDTTYYVETRLDLCYVYFNLQQQNFINNDAAVPGLNRRQAYSLPLLVPGREVLSRFSGMVSLIFAQLLCLRRRSALLRQTRDLLLPRLLSGEIDVAALEDELAGAA